VIDLHSCEYIKELNTLTANFKFHPDSPDCKENHKEALKKLVSVSVVELMIVL
jgi:hypothetical protein